MSDHIKALLEALKEEHGKRLQQVLDLDPGHHEDFGNPCEMCRWIAKAEASLAEPVTIRSRFIAFMQAIPEDLPDPEVMLEEDGEYGVEWYWADSATTWAQVSVSVGKAYSYASLIGGVSEHFGTTDVSQVIAELLRVVPKKDTPKTEASGGAER